VRVVIVGGGAAGLVASWLLDGAHEVVLLEREAVLGGNIRTLNGNVPTTRTTEKLDAGVIEFERTNNPLVLRMLERLNVELNEVRGATTYSRPGLPPLLSPGALRHHPRGPARALAWGRVLHLRGQVHGFLARTALPDSALAELEIGQLLRDDELSQWLALLVMYAYSIPRPQIHQVPALLAVPMLRRFLGAHRWVSVRGGSYHYVERLLGQFRGQVHTNVDVRSIDRTPEGVTLHLADGTLHADQVVLATPPDQILRLLASPSEDESRRFGDWAANHITTTVHCDEGIYERRGLVVRTEFDVFDRAHGEGAYNAWLNRLCAVDEGAFGLAFGLDDELDPAKVLATVKHHTPAYTVPALAWRDEVKACNGSSRTWYAGAWLEDGLHEGAVASAVKVARALGGAPL
jgi:uncharacterized protein